MEFRPILLSLKHNKFLSFLISAQVMLTLTVLSLATTTTRNTLSEWNMPSGLTQHDIISVRSEFFDPEIILGNAIADDLKRLKSLPGVLAVTPNQEIPFDAGGPSKVYLTPGVEAEGFDTNFFDMDENGPKVLDLQLISGRFYRANEVLRGDSQDISGSVSVVMISQDMAQEMFGQDSALGKTLYLAEGADPAQIIGVYSNFMNGESLNGRGKSYHSVLRPAVIWSEGAQPNYLIRVGSGLATGLFADIADSLYQSQGRYIHGIETLTRTQKRMYDGRGSQGAILLVISIILVLIAGFGTAGLVSFLITQRQKQIGIRRALGATKWGVMRYFLLENSILTWFGIVLGVILTVIQAYFMTQNSDRSVLDFGIVLYCALFIWLINIIAVWLPARRAAQVSPAIVTRS